MAQHCLYRFFDSDGDLLYVGITMNPAARWPKHSSGKHWWTEVETITLETFASREAVLAAEREAIKTEQPRYNITHAEKIAPPTPAPERLSWRCEECGNFVGDGRGVLAIRHDEVAMYYEAEEGWRAEAGPFPSVAHLMEHPPAARWHAQHDACFEPDSSMYEIAVEDVRTPAQLLAFTAHLMGKTWLEATDWDRLILEACNRLPASEKGGE